MKDTIKKDKNKHEEQIEELELKVEENENKYKRALADYQNLEKRVREEKSTWIRQAGSDVIYSLLPVLDTLSLAVKHDSNKTLEVSYQQFLEVLKQLGVEKIETNGVKFNAEEMECIETLGEGEDVVEEVRAGFMLNNGLLRPAQVKVGRL